MSATGFLVLLIVSIAILMVLIMKVKLHPTFALFISALFMGCIGITEGAIPFAVKDLGHTLPGICIGSAVGAALAAFQGIDCYVPHGGFIVALATNNVALFCLDIVIGSLVAAAILIAMKPTLDKQAK